MTLYSKNGSIPKPETDGTEGWIEVSDMPVIPEGKEVVWWYPPGWVIRDFKPAATETTDWSWSQTEEQWKESAITTITSTDSSLDITISATASTTLGFSSASSI